MLIYNRKLQTLGYELKKKPPFWIDIWMNGWMDGWTDGWMTEFNITVKEISA